MVAMILLSLVCQARVLLVIHLMVHLPVDLLVVTILLFPMSKVSKEKGKEMGQTRLINKDGWGAITAEELHRQVYQEKPEKKAHLSHQLIAGAAAFEAVKAYRRHQEAKGEEVSHSFIKQSVAALAASQIVKFAEEHDWSSKDKEEATRQAQAAAEHYSTREFGGH